MSGGMLLNWARRGVVWAMAASTMLCVLLIGCHSEPDAAESVGSVTQATTTPPDPPGKPGAGCGRFVEQLANGNVRYAVRFSQAQANVQVFVKVNNVQVIAQSLSGVANGDGTYTYSLIKPASQYHAGDVLQARFFSARPNVPGVFTPGPTDSVWAPSFSYGQTACASDPPSGCHDYISTLANGDLRFSVTLPDTQQFVQIFIQLNGAQIVAQNIASSRVANLGGTSTYSLVKPASLFRAGDVVLTRFYSYKAGQPGVFTPGPLEQIWAPELTVGARCVACGTGLQGPNCDQRTRIHDDSPGKPNPAALARMVPDRNTPFPAALSVAPPPPANGGSGSVGVIQQAIEPANQFSIRFTKIQLGSDGCGGEVEPFLRSVSVNGEPGSDRDLPDHDEDSSEDISDTFTATVLPSQARVPVHVEIFEEDGGLCGGGNTEYVLDLEINNRNGFSSETASAGSLHSSLVMGPRTCSTTLNGWGLCWELVTTGPPLIDNPDAEVNVCTGFKAHFVDAGLGEDALVMPTPGVAPAPFAYAELSVRGVKLFTGYLDVAGCIPIGSRPTRDQLLVSAAEVAAGMPIRFDYKPQFCLGGPATVTAADDCDMAVSTVSTTSPPNTRPGAISWKVEEVTQATLSAGYDSVAKKRIPLVIDVKKKVFSVPTLSAAPTYQAAEGVFTPLGAWLVPGVAATLQLIADRDDPITRSAAVSAQMLMTPDNGIASDIYRVFANDACPSDDPGIIGDSCADGGDLFVGPGLLTLETGDTRYEQTRWKYVIAHEAGHMVQQHVTGTFGFRGEYGYDSFGNSTREPAQRVSFDPPNTDAQCRCDHVDTANRLHCLQSIERSGEAHTEGFAQFYSSKMFNTLNRTDCTFSYYKEMALPTCTAADPTSCTPYTPQPPSAVAQLSRNLPPVKRDCVQAAQWRDRHCAGVGSRTTEMDWMSFYVNLNGAGPAQLTMSDIWGMFGRLCGAGQTPQVPFARCDKHDSFNWSELPRAAQAQFGAADPRGTAVVTLGNAHGVDENTGIAP